LSTFLKLTSPMQTGRQTQYFTNFSPIFVQYSLLTFKKFFVII